MSAQTRPHPPRPPRPLRALLDAAGVRPTALVGADGADPEVRALDFDSRRVAPGSLYLAMPGTATHGARFTAQAVAAGAVAVLTDAAGAQLAGEPGVPVVVVAEPRSAMAQVAAAFHDDPWAKVPILAVTGTNGKTTTAFMVEACLRELGLRVGTIGTIGFRLDGVPFAAQTSTVTTPEAPDLQRLFADMVAEGADAIVMEVSSHALALQRVLGTHFVVAGFTMLGRDHLDFHHDLEDYFAAKASLFTTDLSRRVVVSVDGEWGRRLSGMVGDKPQLRVGRSPDADVRIIDAVPAADQRGQQVSLDLDGEWVEFALGMSGAHNVENAALALGMVHALWPDAARAARGLAQVVVPGRMQPVDLGEDAPDVVVDFAHTPQAITEALSAVQAGGRVITVVGAGGDRDSAKRPLMGRAASECSAVVVVTDDNPRTEEPASIRAAVAEGARQSGADVRDVADRRRAIRTALELAGPDDVVVVLGKGHETGQQVAGRVVDFDDVRVVADVWTELRGERG